MDNETFRAMSGEEQADWLNTESDKLANKIRDEMIDYAEEYIPAGNQVAFLTAVAMTVAHCALRATAKGLAKFGTEGAAGLKGEAEMALGMFAEGIIPEIAEIVRHLGQTADVDGKTLVRISGDDTDEAPVTKH